VEGVEAGALTSARPALRIFHQKNTEGQLPPSAQLKSGAFIAPLFINLL
jgi:hypothetical protein